MDTRRKQPVRYLNRNWKHERHPIHRSDDNQKDFTQRHRLGYSYKHQQRNPDNPATIETVDANSITVVAVWHLRTATNDETQ